MHRCSNLFAGQDNKIAKRDRRNSMNPTISSLYALKLHNPPKVGGASIKRCAQQPILVKDSTSRPAHKLTHLLFGHASHQIRRQAIFLVDLLLFGAARRRPSQKRRAQSSQRLAKHTAYDGKMHFRALVVGAQPQKQQHFRSKQVEKNLIILLAAAQHTLYVTQFGAIYRHNNF